MTSRTNVVRDPYRLSLGGVKAVAYLGISPVIADNRIDQARRRKDDGADSAEKAVGDQGDVRTKQAA